MVSHSEGYYTRDGSADNHNERREEREREGRGGDEMKWRERELRGMRTRDGKTRAGGRALESATQDHDEYEAARDLPAGEIIRVDISLGRMAMGCHGVSCPVVRP